MTEHIRKEFEKWAASHCYLQEFGPERNLDNLDEYMDVEVQTAWEAWKASREHLVIELPYESWTDYQDNGQYDYGYKSCRDDVMEVLEQQGVKWK